MGNDILKKPWPFLVYDRWAGFLRLQMEQRSIAVDYLGVLNNPPYDALSEGDHCGIVFGVEGKDECPQATEGLFRLWLDRLEPDCPFDVDFMAHIVGSYRNALPQELVWGDYEEQMSLGRRYPIRHPAPIAAILDESRGFLFYRNQPARILGLVLDLGLHEVEPLLKGVASPDAMRLKQDEFSQRLADFGVSETYASNLWSQCTQRYYHCLPREYMDSRRNHIFWFLAVRQKHPQLFCEAWSDFKDR